MQSSQEARANVCLVAQAYKLGCLESQDKAVFHLGYPEPFQAHQAQGMELALAALVSPQDPSTESAAHSRKNTKINSHPRAQWDPESCNSHSTIDILCDDSEITRTQSHRPDLAVFVYAPPPQERYWNKTEEQH